MEIDWNSVVAGAGMTVVAHPFTYVKVLIQLGHEPLSPVVGRNMFFRKQLQYPNVFKYMKHIKESDGILGLYRGVGPRICANLSTSLTYSVVGQVLKRTKLIEPTMNREPPTSKDDAKTLLNKVCDHTTKEMIARCSAVVISQPFHVIAIRTMAQFIGQETIYSNMYTSTIEIYNEEGILGFFAGLVPRLAAEIITLWLSNLLAYALNTYVLTETSDLKDLRQYSQMAMSYLAQTATYPLSVTSTVMAVNGARIRGGRPPFMVVYGGWYACLKDLHHQGQSSRGSSMWFRKAMAHAVAATSVSPMPPPPVA